MTKRMLGAINPADIGARIQAARRARGLTQQEVAEHVGVSRTTVTALESGDRRVKPDELAALARLFGRTIGELVMREEPVEPFSVQFRSTLSPASYEEEGLDPYVFEFQRLCEDYIYLEQLSGSALATNYPQPYQLDIGRPERAAEDIANRERNRLGFGDAPILDLRQVLETDVGLRIFYITLPARIAAMFAYTTELGGCIAVNQNHPPERRRQSLAHDYGHFLTDRFRPEVAVLRRYQRVPARERFAETFGRAFLLPQSGVARRFNELHRVRSNGITPADLLALAYFFFVSVEAITRRLEELDLVSSGTWDRLRQLGFRVREAQALLHLPARVPMEDALPIRYLLLAAEAFERGDLSEGQLARFLRTDRVQARRQVARIGHRTALTEEGETALESLDLSLPL